MKSLFKRLVICLTILTILFSFNIAKVAQGATSAIIPIKVAILYDANNPNANLTSPLFTSVSRVLNWNKIPFDSLDISSNKHPALIDGSGNLLYSAAVIQADGAAIDATNNQNILSAIDIGMGAVAVLPSTANATLKSAFGISTVGVQQLSTSSFTVLQDKFTFSYAGTVVDATCFYLNHGLLGSTDVIAASTADNQPLIWTSSYGSGKTVFHNTTATSSMSYWGLLLQSILYVMPIGVASPANVMALNVDDCPITFYTAESLQQNYYDFMANYLRWLRAYNVRSTFYTAFSYSGNINDFWTAPQSLQAAADILTSGNELGFHCGSQHLPLDPLYWGGVDGLIAEVNTMNQTVVLLREKLASLYGLTLPELEAYVAPGNSITDNGYQVLENNTGTKYVGQAFSPDSTAAAQAPAMALTVPVNGSSGAVVSLAAIQYALTINIPQGGTVTRDPDLPTYDAGTSVQLTPIPANGWIFMGWSGDLTGDTNPGVITMDADKTVTAIFTFAEVYKDFGWEGNYNIYNLPRIEGGLRLFGQPQNDLYNNVWNTLRTSLESGQPYIAFTHAEQSYVSGIPGLTMENVFEAQSIWADYIATNYQFYRWMTTTEIGDYLSSRTGVISAQWNSTANTLQLTKAQSDDPVHIKTSKYLNSISASGNTMTMTFIDSPTNFQTDQFDVVSVGGDYFIYPLGQNALMPTVPQQSFVFEPVVPNQSPVLNPVGNKQVNAGQSLTFTVTASDPENGTLTYSASNLPTGAIFNPNTHVFSWTPAVAGTYSGIYFVVSDGSSIDYEEIIVTVTGTQLPPSAEITLPIANGADDGHCGNLGFFNTLAWYEIGNAGSAYNGWFRFTGINIPADAIIDEAYLETMQTQWDAGTSLKIYAEDAASPTAPTSNPDYNNRIRTTAGVPWTSGFADSAWHNSPNFASVIQELVNSYNYAAGGAIQVLVDNNGSANGASAVGATFENTNYTPRLYILYHTNPVVSTSAATGISNSAATLNGNLSSLGMATSVNVSFQWRLSTEADFTRETDITAMTAAGNIAKNLTGLTAGTTYYYRAKAVGGAVTIYGAPIFFTTATSSGGGGIVLGGGLPAGYTSVAPYIGASGILTGDVTATGTDSKAVLTIAKGTKCLNSDGTAISSVSVLVRSDIPAPPVGSGIIGLCYNFGPDGATFNPEASITFSYAGLSLGSFKEQNLALALWDSQGNKWVKLVSVVDTVKQTVTAKIQHFSSYAIMGYPAPAAFTTGNLVVAPTSVETGKDVTVTVSVTNTGEVSGAYTATLQVNGTTAATKDVTLQAGETQAVSFTVTKAEAGTYSISLGGLSGSFTAVRPLRPAAFSVSNLAVTPASVEAGKDVTVTISVSNTGELSGAYTATLQVNGAAFATKDVTLQAGETQAVSFTVNRAEAGAYSVAIGDLQSSLTLLKPAAFTVSDLVINPVEAQKGKAVTVTFKVANTGEVGGSYLAILKVNGTAAGTKEITVGGGVSQVVSFEVLPDKSGTYIIDAAALSGSIVVKQSYLLWWLIGGVVVLVVAGLTIIMVRSKRRSR